MGNDEYNDDESIIDPNTLGDWRKFRMNLANSNTGGSASSSPLLSSAASSIDGMDLWNNSLSSTTAEPTTTTTTSVASIPSTDESKSSPRRPKSVSKMNEKLLSAQNTALAEEYIHWVWAHESATPEVGGLVCRMPLEVEIYKCSDGSSLHTKLRSLLNSEEYGGMEEDSFPTSLSTSMSTVAASSSTTTTTNVSKSSIGDDDDDDVDAEPSSFSALAAMTVFWYRGAERLLRRELVDIMSAANPDGRINPDALSPDSLDLLRRYMDYQNSWQAVDLVIEREERTGYYYSKTVTINRPLAFKLSRDLGMLVLRGAQTTVTVSGGQMGVLPPESNNDVNGIETQNLVKFLSAFESQCGVYMGGPDGMDQPADMIHGIRDLPGAVEISPYTGIYRGGLEAAMDGVLSGRYKPLDFRFFLGHTMYEGRRLDEAVRLGKYQPVACSRPLVLKQCMQLPKPLWHEVLEFCGGELKEISKLELSKRSDLR